MTFSDLSIKHKLVVIVLLTSVTMLLVASVALGIYDRRTSMQSVRKHASQLATLIAMTAGPAVVFGDGESATEILSGLESHSDVRAAAIYDANGREFARYREILPGTSGPPSTDQSFFTDDLFVVYRGIVLEDQRLGTLHIEIDLAGMNTKRDNFVALVGVLLLSLSVVTWVASTRLQHVLSRPILELVEVSQGVTQTKDYSVRAKKRSSDEVGLLADSFNEMLSQIQNRDNTLRGEGDRLEAEVEARTSDLRETNRRLEEATEAALATNRAQSQFIANMTHEIRTPMNGVLGMAELLFNTDLTPQQQKFTRTVLESAEDLLAIINNILDFSKVEAGKLEKVDNKPFNPRECVVKVTELLDSRARPKGLALSHECADDVPSGMLGDGKRVRQVLTNIIGNAIKFTDHGTIVIRTSLVKSVDDTATIRFEVVDSGVGIPAHLHGHVFEGFSQADTSTTRQFGGTGLGLAISKHLVELMGGEIGVISRPGVGSNFWFSIRGDLWRTATAADRDLDGVHALVVATTHMGRDALRHKLTTFGARCTTAVSADEARKELGIEPERRTGFDVALIDTQALDWYALARQIRGHEGTKSLPLVLVSTVTRGDGELRDAGIDGALRQPVKEAELFSCIARVTGRLDVKVAAADNARMDADAWGAPMISSEREADPSGAEAAPAADEPWARVLVAEDNPVNREVATAMLQSLNCAVDVVGDGVEAVAAAKRQAYDLIFLDCQMPNLDGYGAARQLRQLEADGAIPRNRTAWPSRLPIVALTAHTAPADRQQSFDSGMDDYASKPFALKTLQEVLGRWIRPHAAEDAEPAGGGAAAEPDGPEAGMLQQGSPLNEKTLHELRALGDKTGGGLCARVLRSYLETASKTLTQLHEAAAAHDAASMARAAHDLKSTSQNVGAERLAMLSLRLERVAKADTTKGSDALIAEIDQLFADVKEALEERLANGDAGAEAVA